MQYRHHWVYPPTHPDYRHAWPTILADTRLIIDRVRTAGIVIAGPDGRRRPTLDPTEGIGFNGDATTDLDGDPFTLLAPPPMLPAGKHPTATASCATNRKPYDLAVAAVLLRCRLLLPDVFLLRSDGAWEREWAHGSTPGIAGGTTRAGARRLVVDLFGDVPAVNPLHPIPLIGGAD